MSETEKVAKENNIGKVKIKGVPETDDNNVIGSSRTKTAGGTKKSGVASTKNNAIGSRKAEAQAKPAASKPKPKKDIVAVYSTRNVTWPGVGTVSKGYNVVTQEQAEQWKKRSHIREATPEEVAREFGV